MPAAVAPAHLDPPAACDRRTLAVVPWLLLGATLLGIEVTVWHWTGAYDAWENRWQTRLFHVPFEQATLIARIDTYVHIVVAGSATLWLGWTRALWLRRTPWWLPSVLLAVIASADEFLQRFQPGRTAEWHDLLCSMMGIGLATMVAAAAAVIRSRHGSPPVATPAASIPPPAR